MRSALKSRLDHQLAPASDGPRVSPREREWSEPNRTVSKSPRLRAGGGVRQRSEISTARQSAPLKTRPIRSEA
jgi:hypothetical protein